MPAPTPSAGRERAWVEVDTGAIRRNLARVRHHVGPGARIVAMVKCGGYGLGADNVVAALAPERPFGYGVATVAEGVELRGLGVREPVMVCCPVAPADLPRAVAARLVPAISDLDGLDALAALADPPPAPPLPFQVEIDTGMGRAGFALGETGSPRAPWWSRILRAPSRGLRLFGIFTHLHSADEPDLAASRRQVRLFDDFVLRAGGIEPGTLLHFANSAGALRVSSRTANAVRPGIFLYGGSAGPGTEAPESAVSVRARVVLARDVPAGSTVGYGAVHRSRRPERWAAVAIGYGDGLPRRLGNRGWGLAGGRRVPVLGRISMDTTVVGVPDGTSTGDVVTFLGRDGETELTLREVAELADTIGHDILTGLSRRLPRIRTESR